MILNKVIMVLALGGVVTPLASSTINLNNYPISVNNKEISSIKKTNVNDVNPFNPNSLKFAIKGTDGNYYAYYEHHAFPSAHESGRYTYGYELNIGFSSMPDLITSYNAAKKIGINAKGGMLSYLTNSNFFQTAYSGEWELYPYLNANASYGEKNVFTFSFAQSNYDFYSFVQEAINNHQTVNFYFFSDIRYWGKVMIANAETQQTLTTNWYA